MTVVSMQVLRKESAATTDSMCMSGQQDCQTPSSGSREALDTTIDSNAKPIDMNTRQTDWQRDW